MLQLDESPVLLGSTCADGFRMSAYGVAEQVKHQLCFSSCFRSASAFLNTVLSSSEGPMYSDSNVLICVTG